MNRVFHTGFLFLVACCFALLAARTAPAQGWWDDDEGDENYADLSLHAFVYRTAVSVGDTVRIVLILHNAGPGDVGDVRVDFASTGLHVDGAVAPGADVSHNHQRGKWEDIDLGDGRSAMLIVRVTIEQLPAVFSAEVKKSDKEDPDSRPGQGASEDDNVTITFSDAGSSGGGDGGLESNGSLSAKLARVLYERRRNEAILFDKGLTVPEVTFRREESIARARARRADAGAWTPGPVAKSGAGVHDLRSPIPEFGPSGVQGREVSPSDLLPVTNAVDLAAVDYVDATGRRLGVVFAAATETGEVYEHTKVVCDRLRGAALEAIEIVELAGHEFVAAQLVHPDGAVDYTVSFVVYDRGDTFELDSRFILDDYAPPATGRPTYNYQVWAETREGMELLASEMIARLGAIAPVAFRADGAPIRVPDVYVRTGAYSEGRLVLEVVNRADATRLLLEDGSLTTVEGGERHGFSHEVVLPGRSEDDPYAAEVGIDIGPVFDADFSVASDSSSGADLLYLADGSWSWAADSLATIGRFAVRPANAERFGDPGTYAVERGGSLEGSIASWATMFRYLRPNGAPVNLSDYAFLEFVASGEGEMRVQIEKRSLAGSQQYGQVVALVAEPRTYRIWFDQLRTPDGEAGFTAEDVTLISFNADNVVAGGALSNDPTVFAMNVDDVRFRGAAEDLSSTRPLEPLLSDVYPNPVRGEANVRFDLPGPATVRVSLFDAIGRRVAVLADGWRAAGPHTASFDTSGLARGVYFVWLESDIGSKSRGMVVE